MVVDGQHDVGGDAPCSTPARASSSRDRFRRAPGRGRAAGPVRTPARRRRRSRCAPSVGAGRPAARCCCSACPAGRTGSAPRSSFTNCACAHDQDSSRSGNSACDIGSLDAHRRQQRARRHARQPGLGDLEHDQHEPRAQPPVTLRLGRRQHPREVGRIEVDDREIVRFEVASRSASGSVRTTSRCVDSDHVARAVQAHRQRRDRLAVVRRRPA